MSRPKTEHAEIRQILVAMDTVSDNLAFMDSAVELAAQLEAELDGLFVEDTDLLRAAGLPVSREVWLWTARERNPTEMEMALSLRALAARIEDDLAQAARRARIRWSFRVVRGPRLKVFSEAQAGSDLMLLGPARYRRMAPYRGAGAAKGSAVVAVFYTGTAAARRALQAGMRLAGQGAGRLEVLLSGQASGLSERRREELDVYVKDSRVSVQIVEIQARGNQEAVISELSRLNTATLICPADADLVRDPVWLQRLQETVNCPLLLVR